LWPVRCLALALCALAPSGCSSPGAEPPLGGAIGSTDPGGSGGAGGAAGSAGQSVGGSSSAGASAGGSAGQVTAGSSTGGAMACSSYMDEAGYTLPVHIKNTSTKTLYVGQSEMTCQAERLFQVEDGARHVLPSLDGCHTSCQALMQTGPVACPLACAAPVTIALAPGQTIDVPWDGRFAVPQTLPTQCMPSTVTSPTSCVQAQQIDPALFTFIAQAGTQRQCLDPSGTCPCTPSANGTCTSASTLITGTIITTEFLIKLEPGETSPSGAPPYIGLEFKDVAN
jgi:hypothetical protein